MIQGKQLKAFIAQGENQRVEFKRELSDEVFQNLSKELAALANTEGGVIIVGIDNARIVLGVKSEQASIGRVYQEASNCIPPVTVNAYEQRIGPNRLVIIEVPKSTYIHCDKTRRFPQRIGDRTEFMETQMILLLAKSRNLVEAGSSSEPRPLLYPATESSTKAPSKQDTELISLLSNPSNAVRLAAVQDLHARASRIRIEEVTGFWKSITSALHDQSPDVRRWTLMLLETFVNQFQVRSLKIKSKRIAESIGELALNDPDASVRASAFQLMCWMGIPEYLDKIVKMLMTSSKENYASLNPQYNLSHLTKRRLWNNLRRRLYSELESAKDNDTQARAAELLSVVRYFP